MGEGNSKEHLAEYRELYIQNKHDFYKSIRPIIKIGSIMKIMVIEYG